MKKWLCVFLSVALLLCCVACNRKSDSSSSQKHINMKVVTQTDIPVDPMHLGDVCHGYACVVRIDGQDESFVYINPNGEYLSPTTYDFAYSFGTDKSALVYLNNKYVYINTNGEIIRDANMPDYQGDDYSVYYEKDGKKGLLDKEGRPITEAIFHFARAFSTTDDSEFVLAEYEINGVTQSCLVNRQGEQISLPYICSNAYISGEFIHCTLTKNGCKQETVLDMNGKEILTRTYDLVQVCGDTYFAIIQDGKLGLLNIDGSELIPPSISCDYTPDMNIGFGENYITVSINGCLAFVEISNETLIEE